MIRRERLRLNYHLMSPLDIRLIKGAHQKMDICRQRLHHAHLLSLRSNNRRNHIRGLLIHIYPCWVCVVFHGLEMAGYALRGPCCEVLPNALWDAAGLETERVAAEVDGLVVGVNVWCVDACFL